MALHPVGFSLSVILASVELWVCGEVKCLKGEPWKWKKYTENITAASKLSYSTSCYWTFHYSPLHSLSARLFLQWVHALTPSFQLLKIFHSCLHRLQSWKLPTFFCLFSCLCHAHIYNHVPSPIRTPSIARTVSVCSWTKQYLSNSCLMFSFFASTPCYSLIYVSSAAFFASDSELLWGFFPLEFKL